MTLIKVITSAILLSILATLEIMASVPDDFHQAPADRLMTNDELVALLDTQNDPVLVSIVDTYNDNPTEGLSALTSYFREAFSSRYYFDWKKLQPGSVTTLVTSPLEGRASCKTPKSTWACTPQMPNGCCRTKT